MNAVSAGILRLHPSAPGSPPADIILVGDDDPNDVFILRRLLLKAAGPQPVVCCANGEDVVAYLRPFAEKTRTSERVRVLFLDIKMPRLDGFEVLRWVRSQPAIASLPVVILSGSDEPRDLQRARELGATRYLIKHPPPTVFAELLAQHTSRS